MIHTKQIIIASLLVILAAIPVTLIMQQEPQDTRSRATASTTLSYAPNTTTNAPLQKNIGDPVAVDVVVTPGSNLPSLIKLEMKYDPAKFDVATTSPFTVNTAAFPSTVEGPVVTNGSVLISVSIGSDVTKAIQQPTKVGTLNLIAKAPTEGTVSEVSFGTRSQILSLAQSDEATENVLATTQPSYISIAGNTASPTVTALATATTIPTATTAPTATVVPSPTPTMTPTPTPLPSATPTPTAAITQTPTATVNPTQTPMPTPTINPSATTLSFDILIHGIGVSGDNANPIGSDLSNKEPQYPSRNVTVYVYDDQNQLSATKSGLITYDATSGSFKGNIDIGSTILSGDYTVRIKESTHLRRLVPGIQRLTAQSVNIMPQVALVAGDVNGDNTINILDYNLLVGCYSDLLPAISCTDENKVRTDLNDNGGVNQFDYNLFLREITVQSGN
jgi:hypothetical protein